MPRRRPGAARLAGACDARPVTTAHLTRSRSRTLRAVLGIGAVLALIAVAAVVVPLLRPPGPRPLFQLPVGCGETWQLGTYPGHDDYDVDLFPVEGEAWGQPVLASYGGTVTVAGVNGSLGGRTPDDPDGPRGRGGGYWVKIDHGGRWETQYLHLLETPMVGSVSASPRASRSGGSAAPATPVRRTCTTSSAGAGQGRVLLRRGAVRHHHTTTPSTRSSGRATTAWPVEPGLPAPATADRRHSWGPRTRADAREYCRHRPEGAGHWPGPDGDGLGVGWVSPGRLRTGRCPEDAARRIWRGGNAGRYPRI